MMMMPTAMTQRRLFCTRVRKDQMERSCAGKGRNPFWFVIFASLVFWIFLFSFHSSTLMSRKNEASSLAQEYARAIVSRETKSLLVTEEDDAIGSARDKVVEPVNHQVSENKTEHDEPAYELETIGEEGHSRDSVTAKETRPTKKLANGESQSVLVKQPSELKKRINPVNQMPIKEIEFKSDLDPCMGRYIYVHKLPSQFNDDMLKNCRSLSMWTDMCRFMSNAGLGPPLGNSERVYSNTGWFATNQFALDVIFHNRLKHYRCLTDNSSMASAIFVPFYAGLDVGRYLWGFNTTIRDSAALDLFRWLTARPEWKVMGGRDHFLVAGRISWDFRRVIGDESDWGNKLLLLPEAKNMSSLLIESSPWHSNDFAIPYPTYFHPSRDSEVWQWQNRMRRQRRRFLFSFAGAPRPNLEKSIRSLIIQQCRASRRKCKLLECDRRASKCHNPSSVMKLFQSSIFCLQPPGDSYTRRSAFDSILAGCIPVFFHPGSAYVQYIWHLPKNYTKYSVFIPEEDVREGKVSLEKWLHQIPKEEVRAMRKEVIRLIPRVIYAAPNSRLETLQDAFDLAVQGVIERVNSMKRELKEGKNSNEGYEEKNSWKYNLFRTEGKHEWDPYFSKPREAKSQ